MDPVRDNGWKYKHVTGDLQILAGRGKLHSVTINSPATVAGVVTLYDNPAETGDVIAALTIDTLANGQQSGTLVFDIKVENGLYAGFDGTLAGADLTVTYY